MRRTNNTNNAKEDLENIYSYYKKCFGTWDYDLYKMTIDLETGHGFHEEETLRRIFNKICKKDKNAMDNFNFDDIDTLIEGLKDYNDYPQTEEQKNTEKATLKEILDELKEITNNSNVPADNTIYNQADSIISALDDDEQFINKRDSAYRMIFNNTDRIINYENREKRTNSTSLVYLLEEVKKILRRNIPAENSTYNILSSIQARIGKNKELRDRDKKTITRILNSYESRLSNANIRAQIESIILNESIVTESDENIEEETIHESTEDITPIPIQVSTPVPESSPTPETTRNNINVQDTEEEIEEVLSDVDSNNRRAEKLYYEGLKSAGSFLLGAAAGFSVARFTGVSYVPVLIGSGAIYVVSKVVENNENKKARIERIQDEEDYENEHPNNRKPSKIRNAFKKFIASKYTRLFVGGFVVGYMGVKGYNYLKSKGLFGSKTAATKGTITTGKGNAGTKIPSGLKDPVSKGTKTVTDSFKPLTREQIMKDPSVLDGLDVDLSGIKAYSSSTAKNSTSIMKDLAKNAEIIKSGNGKMIRNGKIITKSLDGDYLGWYNLKNKKVLNAINKALKLAKR